MPKARETCTRCSMRRQKCDRQQPCARCVDAGKAACCTRTWVGGYDPRKHRVYPKNPNSQGRRRNDSKAGRDWQADQASRTSRQASITGSTNSSLSECESSPGKDHSIGTIVCDSEGPSFAPDMYGEPHGQYHDFRQQKLRYLQQLLPTHTEILQLIEYHEACLLWQRNCIHGPTFRQEVATNLQHGQDRILLETVDLRWTALLFAVLSASVACAPVSQIRRWKFVRAQRDIQSTDWYAAAIECLRMADFQSTPHIYSIQAIQVLGMSAHLLGLSSKQLAMQGIALQIAQSLGLQRLPYMPEGNEGKMAGPAQICRETCRRAWWSLVVTDWFAIPSYDSYSIHPAHWTSPRPRPYASTRTDSEWRETHALSSFTNYSIDIATVMVSSHMAAEACADTDSKYTQVLKHDSKLRQLQEWSVPSWDPSVPWLPWATRAARIVLAHKILMVHRHFLGRSLKDPRYAYTRMASIEASKAIVREVGLALEDTERPHIWSDHCYLIGAAVTLCLDTMHRTPNEPEFQEHRKLVDQALLLLDRCDGSVLASRGRRLLSAMVKEGTEDRIAETGYDGVLDLIKNNEDLRWAWSEHGYMGNNNNSSSNTNTNNTRKGGNTAQPSGQADLWPHLADTHAATGLGPAVACPAATAARMMESRAPLLAPLPAATVHMQHIESTGLNGDEILGDPSWMMLSDIFPDQQLNHGDVMLYHEGIDPQLAQ